MFAFAVVFAVAAIPAVCPTNCCALSSDALRMMASMACCGETSKIQSDFASPGAPEATLVSSNQISPRAHGSAVGIIAAAAPVPVVTFSVSPVSPPDLAGATPPIFLRDAQFRI